MKKNTNSLNHKEIEIVLKKGTKRTLDGVRFVFLKKDTFKNTKVSFIVSKKEVKKAHQRNLMKRRARHALKSLDSLPQNLHAVFFLNKKYIETKPIFLKEMFKKLLI